MSLNGQTPLIDAINTDEVTVRMITPETARELDGNQGTPLHCAIIHFTKGRLTPRERDQRLIPIVKKLMLNGCPVDAQNKYGSTALSLAERNGLVEVAAILKKDLSVLQAEELASPPVRSITPPVEDMEASETLDDPSARNDAKRSASVGSSAARGNSAVNQNTDAAIKAAQEPYREETRRMLGGNTAANRSRGARIATSVATVILGVILGALTVITLGQWQWPRVSLQHLWQGTRRSTTWMRPTYYSDTGLGPTYYSHTGLPASSGVADPAHSGAPEEPSQTPKKTTTRP